MKMLPLLSPAARVVPSRLNATEYTLASPKLLVQWAAAISHRQTLSEAMARVAPEGLKATDVMGTLRQSDGSWTGTAAWNVGGAPAGGEIDG